MFVFFSRILSNVLVGVCLSSFGIILMSLLLQLRNLPRMMSGLQTSLRSLLRFSFEIYAALLTRIRVWVLYYTGIDLLPRDIRSAVLNTTGTIISFRVGYSDASQLAKEIFPSPYFIQSINPAIRMRTSGNIPFPNINPRIEKEGWDGLARVLANPKPR